MRWRWNDRYEVTGVFPGISKSFDVCPNGLIYKLNQNEITGNLFNIIINFLEARKQRVILNGQYFSRVDITAGIPQG